MKRIKLIALLLSVVLLFNIPLASLASAENSFANKSAFEFKISSADAEKDPGNMLVQLYCTTDSSKEITTFGTTLVIDTNYIDIVSKKGEVITDSYKVEAVKLGSNFALYPSKINGSTFGGMKGLSVASYNSSTKSMYIFICGMAISGIKLKGETEVATFYLKSKTDKIPASALRAMANSETGTDCPSRAVYCGEISSTDEAGDIVNKIDLDVDSSLIDKSSPEESTTKKQVEETTTTKPAPIQPTTALSDETIDKMSEAEVESNIKKIVAEDKDLNLSEKVKSSKAYKTYEKALENAEKVLADKNATKAQKAEALKELVKAKTELEKEFPEVVSSENSNEVSKAKTSIWIYVAIAVGIAAIIIVLIIIIIKKRKTN